jgi:hypothetical protein
MSIWRRRFRWLGTTPSSVRVTSAAEEMVDGMAEVVVRSGTAKRWPFHQRGDNVSRVRWRRIPHGDVFKVSGAIHRPLKDTKTGSMAGPPHNSG